MKRIIKYKIPLLPAILAAMVAGIICGLIFPHWAVRIFLTFNGLFGNFLGFIVPILIVGLVASGIAELGKSAKKLLIITVALAYAFTLLSGYFSYFTSMFAYKFLLTSGERFAPVSAAAQALKPYFTVAIPPFLDVMTALVLAFTLGLGMAAIESKALKPVMDDFRDIIYKTIQGAIIPVLPLYIFGIFMQITVEGQVASVLGVFIKIIIFILLMTLTMLVIQFMIAGAIARKNPFIMLKNMIPAYVTALGTQSSAATIPVTLQQTIKNGVREDIAGFVIPLCATIHLSGSTMKIVACSLAIMMMSYMPIDFVQYSGFIFMLGITMVAAPGVPGGAIMAAIGILQSMLGFDQTAIGLMIALYIAMDSFGTACNVTGDCAVATIINKVYRPKAAVAA